MKNTPTKSPFVITLKIGSDTLTGKGETAFDALNTLKVPEKIVGKGFLTIECGKAKREMMLLPVRLKRLFYSSRNTRIINAKALSLGMK